MPGALAWPAQRSVEPNLQRGMYVRVADCRVALRRPPARILHDRASGEESIDDIVHALENGTVRDLHVRELDLSGTQRQTTAPCARRRVPFRNARQRVATEECGDRWLSRRRRRRRACEAGNACVGWSAGGFAREPHRRAVTARYVLMRCFACTAALRMCATQPADLTSHVCAHVSGEARAAGGCGRRGVGECGE